MSLIKVITGDGIIWNSSQVQHAIIDAMHRDLDIILDFLREGPDFKSLPLYEFVLECARTFEYDLGRITMITSNALERHEYMSVKYQAPTHLVKNATAYLINYKKKSQLKHFGMFIGRSNAVRLLLASYIDANYQDKSVYTYNFNTQDEFHINNIGLEDLLKKYAVQDLSVPANFLKKCPIRLQQGSTVSVDKSLTLNPAQQLLQQDQEIFCAAYQDFFVEIVCESYFTGTTFFPTEKIWRPMMLKTPFIVQGPQYFLHNLRKMGFRTFDQWWDEGYAEDPCDYQIIEIKKVIDYLAHKSVTELNEIYFDMQEILEHNYQLVLQLDKEDFLRLYDNN